MQYICGPTWDQRVVNINPKPKVALLMSGGIDSLVLYHLLSREAEVEVYTADRDDGFDTPLNVASLIGYFPKTIKADPTNPPEMMVKAIQNIRGIDVYLGLNVQPPVEHFPQFDIDGRPYRPFYIPFPNIKAPFLHLYKYHIIDLAHKEGIDISETQSCLEYTVGHCNRCWQCREITWAFDMLRKENDKRHTPVSPNVSRKGTY
jgi:hypothetical protein